MTTTQFILLFLGSLIWLYLASRLVSRGIIQSFYETIKQILKEVKDGKEGR